jgi:hypothetical protein
MCQSLSALAGLAVIIALANSANAEPITIFWTDVAPTPLIRRKSK